MDQENQFRDICMRILANDFPGGIEGCATMLKTYGNHPAVRYNMALAHECSTNFVAAAAEYKQVLEDFPDYMPAYMGLANCCLYAGDAETAEGLVRKARELQPLDPRPAILLSEILFLRGMENEGVQEHLAAVGNVDVSRSIPTHSHAQCYIDLGDGASCFHMFLERSLVQRDAFPSIYIQPPQHQGTWKTVFIAHTGNAADINRRLATMDRSDVYLLALDEISTKILEDHKPDASTLRFEYEAHELPTVALFVAKALAGQGYKVLVPADDGRRDNDKLEWAQKQTSPLTVSLQGDVAAWPEAEHLLDYRRVPPLLRKGQFPDPMIFSDILQTTK